MTVLDTDRDEITVASDRLSRFIVDLARHTERDIGFGFVLTPDAPNTYPALLAAFEHSWTSGEPLPISNENSDAVVYTDPFANVALRFWHDVNHVRRRLSFDLIDELELSLWHLGELEKAGHPPNSLVWRMLHADLAGQAYVQAFAKRFPDDQRRFVRGCVTAGFDRGLLDELRSGARTQPNSSEATPHRTYCLCVKCLRGTATIKSPGRSR
ncbi:hypothetical protein ACHIPZ_06505 [Antrihabitans sp. NCIMB 15449]|uniref:Uncharacterized protein n=1 Tax=Antrihabitans spumae TaxID=3373370 RepID=A0ABW7JLI7_9NOCA